MNDPLHFCVATASCKGGRNDCFDWSRVNCLACLESRPAPTSQDIDLESSRLRLMNDPLHFCVATATCEGGRNDCFDWSRVNCPDCLESIPLKDILRQLLDLTIELWRLRLLFALQQILLWYCLLKNRWLRFLLTISEKT